MTHDRTFVRSIHQGQTTAVQVGFGAGTDSPEIWSGDAYGWMDEFLLHPEGQGVITRQFFTRTGAAMVLVIDRKGLRVVGGEDQPPAEDAPVLWDSETFDADADGDCTVCGGPARWYLFPSVPLPAGPVPDELRLCDRHAARAAADGAKIDSLRDEA